MIWLIIENTKYDITEFIKKHPGGENVLLAYHQMDATDAFTEFHKSSAAKTILKTLPIISKENEVITPQFDLDMRNLRKEFIKEELFKPNFVFYTQKLGELIFLLGISIWFMINNWWWTSVLVMGLFFQQSGWLAHDFTHNQVTHKYRSLFVHLVGNIFQGFSGAWWLNKHNLHHARTNALDEINNKPVEEDFNTAPIIYWTEKLIVNKQSWFGKVWTRYQGYILWVVLPFSKLMWDKNSIMYAFKVKAWTELACIFIHYLLLSMFVITFNKTYTEAFMYYFVSRLWGGFLLAWVFIQSHNGMTYYKRPTLSFYESQVMSTRNMSLDSLSTWFTGGLNYQIEHHLFPRMPRHNLSVISNRVKEVCLRNGIKYEVMNIFSCSKWLTKYLNKIGKMI